MGREPSEKTKIPHFVSTKRNMRIFAAFRKRKKAAWNYLLEEEDNSSEFPVNPTKSLIFGKER